MKKDYNSMLEKSSSFFSFSEEKPLQREENQIKISQKKNLFEISYFYDSELSEKTKNDFFSYLLKFSNLLKKGENNFILEEPTRKIAFFFHDLYYHREQANNKKKNHNLEILLHYLSKGYSLISVYSDEWLKKRSLVEKRIEHKFNLTNKICNARDTVIKEISKIDYNNFVMNEHLQGVIYSKIRLAAFYKDKIVAVMSFDKRRLALGAKKHLVDQNEYEMIRFCTAGNVPGVGSKLLKHFITNYSPKKITTYCDRRWGEGDFYLTIGFKKQGSSEPCYFYTNDCHTRHYRFTFRKDALISKFNADPNKTEVQIAREMGFDRIWDCGTNKFIMEF